jgi:hypothetical protein
VKGGANFGEEFVRTILQVKLQLTVTTEMVRTFHKSRIVIRFRMLGCRKSKVEGKPERGEQRNATARKRKNDVKCKGMTRINERGIKAK